MDSDPNNLVSSAPGIKLDDGKTLAGLLGDFSLALTAVADVGTFGAKKYSRGNWQYVENGYIRYTDAMWRHILEENQEVIDPESKCLHAAAIAWNALARLEIVLRHELETKKSKSDESQAQLPD